MRVTVFRAAAAALGLLVGGGTTRATAQDLVFHNLRIFGWDHISIVDVLGTPSLVLLAGNPWAQGGPLPNPGYLEIGHGPLTITMQYLATYDTRPCASFGGVALYAYDHFPPCRWVHTVPFTVNATNGWRLMPGDPPDGRMFYNIRWGECMPDDGPCRRYTGVAMVAMVLTLKMR